MSIPVTGVVAETSDDAAVVAASLRDPQRFAALYQRYAADVYRYVYRRIGPPAEDVVAETFVIAFDRRSSFDQAAASARPWLFGIATRQVSRYRRTERARYRALARLGATPTTDGAVDQVAADVTARMVGADMVRAIRRLPAGDRDTLLLFVWGGLSYEEIAAALGIPTGTVRSRLSRARRKVREALHDAEPTRSEED